MLLLTDNDPADKQDCWFSNPCISSSSVNALFTNKQQVPSTLLSYFENINNHDVIRDTQQTIFTAILGEDQKTSVAEIRAVLRFIRLVATHSVQSKDGKEMHTICTSTLSRLTSHIINNITATSDAVRYYIFYLHPIVLHGGKSFLLSPLWKGICDLLEHPLIPVDDVVLPPLAEYFKKGHQALTQSIQNQNVKAVQNHIKLISFFIARFTFIAKKLESNFENPQQSIRYILLSLCQWKGIIYQQRKILPSSQNLSLFEALEVLDPKIDTCFEEVVLIAKSNITCFYPKPITIIMETFSANYSDNITCMESASIGIIQCLYHVGQQMIELPLHSVEKMKGNFTYKNKQVDQTDLQWITQVCSTLLSHVTPFLLSTVISEAMSIGNISSDSQVWKVIIDIVLLYMRKISSVGNMKQISFLFAKWCEPSATPSIRNALTREVTIHSISQHITTLLNQDPSSSKALYLLYFFSKLIFSSLPRLQHIENLVEILIRVQHNGASMGNTTWLTSVQYCIWHVYLGSKTFLRQHVDIREVIIIFPLLECLPPYLFPCKVSKQRGQIGDILLPLKPFFALDDKENVRFGQKNPNSTTVADIDSTCIPYGITLLNSTLRSCHAAESNGHLKQTNEVPFKFEEYTGESLISIVTLLLKGKSQAFPIAVIAALLRFFSLIVMYQCMGTSLLSPLIQWLEEVVGSFDAYTKGEKVLVQIEALPILREIGKWIPLSFDQNLLKVRGQRNKNIAKYGI
jgi:hypothetical protein